MEINLTLRALALAAVPSLSTAAGAFFDEAHHFGITNWRSACRASGLSLTSIITFTFQLLPTAVAGALAGAFLIVLAGIVMRRTPGAARSCLATHAGCALAMILMLPLCALLLSSPVTMWLADLALAVVLALIALRLGARRERPAPAHP